MSNPNNLPTLDGWVTIPNFKATHLGPQAEHVEVEHDFSPEAVRITIESHYWLPGEHTEADVENVAGWVADWLETSEDVDPEFEMALGEWLQDAFQSFADDGIYRLNSDDFKALASLSDAMAFLDVNRV